MSNTGPARSYTDTLVDAYGNTVNVRAYADSSTSDVFSEFRSCGGKIRSDVNNLNQSGVYNFPKCPGETYFVSCRVNGYKTLNSHVGISNEHREIAHRSVNEFFNADFEHFLHSRFGFVLLTCKMPNGIVEISGNPPEIHLD